MANAKRRPRELKKKGRDHKKGFFDKTKMGSEDFKIGTLKLNDKICKRGQAYLSWIYAKLAEMTRKVRRAGPAESRVGQIAAKS